MNASQNDAVPMRFGEGKISGYLAAFLGMMGLGGVLCFHFPWLLTTPELTSRLSVETLRRLLLAVLVFAFVLGLTNFLIGRHRALGYAGMLAATAAVLLGGATVQPSGATAISVAPLGLDSLLLGLLFNALLFVPLERIFPLRREQLVLRAEWTTDLAYFALANLLVSVLLTITTATGPLVFGWAVSPVVQGWVRSQPMPVQFLEMLVVADLAQYALHRRLHEHPLLWRIHAVHHSAVTMDWLAGSRLHLLEVMLTRTTVFVPLYLLGFSREVLYTYIGFVSLHAVLIHANLGVSFGPLRYLVATPLYHHWHHSADPAVVNRNYAVHLPVIDYLFGTYHQPARFPDSYGLVGETVPPGLWAQHLYPLSGRRAPTAPDHVATDTPARRAGIDEGRRR